MQPEQQIVNEERKAMTDEEATELDWFLLDYCRDRLFRPLLFEKPASDKPENDKAQ